MNKQDRKALSEEMHHHIELWQQSKTTQNQYCIENNLAYHKFIYWLHKGKGLVNYTSPPPDRATPDYGRRFFHTDGSNTDRSSERLK